MQNLIRVLLHHQLNALIGGTLLAEIHDVLNRPGVLKDDRLSAEAITEFIQQFTVSVAPRPSFILSPDPEYNYLFDIALQYGALFIVTDEKALLRFTAAPVAVRSLQWFKEQFPKPE